MVGGFGGSVPVVVLMCAQQLQRFCGLGEDADGLGSAHLHRVGVALAGEDVGDAINGGLEPDRIAGSGAGNDQLQTMLGSATEPHEALLRSQCGLLLGADRVGFDDLGLQ